MTCLKLAEGEVVRITRLDNCGNPVEGADNAWVDDCMSEITMAPNFEDGTDIDFRAMNGRSCGFKKGRKSFRGFDVTLSFYNAAPQIIEMLTGNPVYLDYNGDPIGWDDCGAEGKFALEIWVNAIGEDCPEDSDSGLFYYFLLPFIDNGGLSSDTTIGQDGVTFEVTGNTRANGRWQLGPWDVVPQDSLLTPGPLLVPLGGDCHRRPFSTPIAPPTAACDYVTVPANNTSS